ncbi:MAG: putative Ig domain-containing protein [Steroidobacteraceae bacterium]
MSLAVALAACQSTNRSVQGSVGVGTGVTLTTPGSVTQIQAGTTIAVGASVTSDVNNAGVTWSLVGAGSLTDATPTSVTYNAPASADGAVDATITATSIANTATAASVTLIVLGTPVMEPVQPFPGNVNVAYGAPIAVDGGEANYTCTSTGTLPPGIILNGSTSSITALSGTPTAAGSYTFTVSVTDALGRVATQTITMVVNGQTTCLLTGTYTFVVSGFRGGGPMTHAGSITIDNNGNITGETDYKDGHRTTPKEVLDSTSICTNRQTNSGTVFLNSSSAQIQYNFSLTPPDSQGNLNYARLQLIGSGSDSAAGEMRRLDTTTIAPNPPVGNFAFGLVTVANQEPDTVHTGSAGRFTSDTSGTISAGLTDSNASPALTAAPLIGSLTAPDAMGRGTATFTAGGETSSYAYYLNTSAKTYLVNMDPTVGSIRSSGYMSSQVGNAGGGSTFDNGALASGASILSLWGAIGNGIEPIAVMTLGRLSGGNATAATIDGILDVAYRDTGVADTLYSAQPYQIQASGRGTLGLTNLNGTRNFVLYLDGIGNGYVIELGSPSGNVGLLEAQYQPAGGSYPDTLLGYFVGGTQFVQSPGPIVLVPTVTLAFGVLSSNFTSGQFAVDPTSGRGFGSMTLSGITNSSAALYLVSPTKLDVMTFGDISTDGTILWLQQN